MGRAVSATTAQLVAALIGAVAVLSVGLVAAFVQVRNLRAQLRAEDAHRAEDRADGAVEAQQTFTAAQLKLLYDGQWQRIDDLKSEVATLKAEQGEQARRAAEREAQVEALREDMAQIRAIERILRQENTQLRERVQKLTEENTLLHSRVAGLEERLSQRAAGESHV